MKKLLLCLAFIFTINAAFAQTWCPPGAKWHFKYGGTYIGSFSNCDLDIVYTSDTTVLGIPCKKLKGTIIGQVNYNYNYNAPVLTQHYDTYITHLNNGVLFLYNTGKSVFDTIVNFNAAIGDKWLRPGPDPDPNGCIARSALTVTDTTHVLINGFNLKKITATFPSDTNSSITYTTAFLERMLITGGSFSNYYSTDLFHIHCDINSVIVDAPSQSFRCYEDNLFPTYNAGTEACKNFFTGFNNQALNNLGFTAYPNPANNQLTLELPDARIYEIRLVTLLGQTRSLKVTAQGDAKLQADLSAIDAGVYLIQVLEDGRPVGIEKLIIE